MAVIDKIQDRIREEGILEGNLELVIDEETYAKIKEELKILFKDSDMMNDSLNVDQMNMDKSDLMFFFGVDVRITKKKIDHGFEFTG